MFICLRCLFAIIYNKEVSVIFDFDLYKNLPIVNSCFWYYYYFTIFLLVFMFCLTPHQHHVGLFRLLVFIQCNIVIIIRSFYFILLCSQFSESLNLQIRSFFICAFITDFTEKSHHRYDFSAPSFDHHHMLCTHSCDMFV